MRAAEHLEQANQHLARCQSRKKNMDPMPMTLEDLIRRASAGCENPACDHRHHGHLFLRPRCHDTSAVRVAVDPHTRTLIVECATCGWTVAAIKEGP